MNDLLRDKDYAKWLKDLKKKFRETQIKAAVKVNSELLKFYWDLGREIVKNKEKQKGEQNFLKD